MMIIAEWRRRHAVSLQVATKVAWQLSSQPVRQPAKRRRQMKRWRPINYYLEDKDEDEDKDKDKLMTVTL